MEKKRYYRRPSCKLIPLDTTEFLAGSETLSRGHKDEGQSPQPDEDGIIWVESKRQGNRVIDDSEDW